MHLRRSLAALFVTCLALIGITVTASAATIQVPSTNTPTIQSGINAANNGDIVVVAPGTYYENVDFKGKAITVTSSGGSAVTILDGGTKGPAVTFQTSEPRAAVLSNFTIQHGGNFPYMSAGQYVPYAAGIQITQSAPTILNNVITLNDCWAIRADQSGPLIQGNEISATQDPHGQCSFGGGAGIYVGGNLNSPGPISSAGTSAIIVGNTIENNVESGIEDAGGNGGAAIAVWGGSPLIEENILRNNASPGGSGGAINVEAGTAISIVQNLIYGNSAGCGGGSIAFMPYPLSGSPQILIANNTIVNNIDAGPGGYTECTDISQIYPDPDAYGDSGPSTVLVNNIIDGSVSYPAVNCDAFGPPTEWTQPTFDHNLLYNGGNTFFGSYCIDVSAKYGNIAADPRFVNPAANDFHLSSNSPAIDAGNNSALALLQQLSGIQLTKDLDGNTRVQDATAKGYPIIDIGAYEFAGTVEAPPTTIVLTPSAYAGAPGNGYALTATLASSLGIPTGSITFYMDGNNIGTANISTSVGVATLSSVSMTPGVHVLYASYPGQGSFEPATSVIVLVNISLYSTTVSLTSSANPSLLGQPVTFTVQVWSADGTIPSPIVFTIDSNTVDTLTPNASGVATYTTSSLAVGSHQVRAYFAADSTRFGSTDIVDQVVVAGFTTATVLNASPNPANVGQTVTFTATVTNTFPNPGPPPGSVTFSDGTTVLGSAALSSSSSLSATASITTSFSSAGTYTITATYVPTGGFSPSSGQLVETVNGLPSGATLSAAPNPALFGTSVTLTAGVTVTSGTPTGSITFYDGASSIGAASLNSAGQASLTTSSLAVGSHALTAVYSGNSTYATSTSAPFTEVIKPLPQDFTITLASPSISIKTQHHTTTSLTLASVSGFADSLTLSCANLPQYVTCQPTPNPASLIANGSTSVSVYLDTDSVIGYAHLITPTPPAPFKDRSAPISLALLLSPLSLLALSRKSRRAFGVPRLIALLLALLPLSLALSGCGEIILPYDPPPFATPGTYTIPITAVGATSHISHTANLTLTITP